MAPETSKGIKSNKIAANRFASLFKGFSGTRSFKRDGKDPKNTSISSAMTLKLKSPGAADDEAHGTDLNLLTDILKNGRLFDMLDGTSVVLQAEITVNKSTDGAPEIMTISGLVPATLTKGERNGKPTREIRVRGYLRRRKTDEERLPYDDLAFRSSAFGYGGKIKESQIDRKPHTEESTLVRTRRPTIRDRYRTMSTVSARSRRGSIIWPQGDGEAMDSDDEEPESSRIENWSPLFDFSSPMSGRNERDRVRALSDWSTPTPRFDLGLKKDEGDNKPKGKAQEQRDLVNKTTRTSYSHTFQRGGTKETGNQTDSLKEARRVHTSIQTDPKELGVEVPQHLPKTSLTSAEEIQQKNESKQTAVREKATSKFSEVHGRVHDIVCKREGFRKDPGKAHSCSYDEGQKHKENTIEGNEGKDKFHTKKIRDEKDNSTLRDDNLPKAETQKTDGSRNECQNKARVARIMQNTEGSGGKTDATLQQRNDPVATITISRSHTRLYNYSDGYTYTEKVGRQMVVVEAPKGMYYAQ